MASKLRVNQIEPVNGIPTGGGGGIIQVKMGFKDDGAANTTSGSWTDTGLSCTITPTSVTSKILCMVITMIDFFNYKTIFIL